MAADWEELDGSRLRVVSCCFPAIPTPFAPQRVPHMSKAHFFIAP